MMSKKAETNFQKFDSISEVHRVLGLPRPMHPLITLIKGGNATEIKRPKGAHVLNFYKISFSSNLVGKVKYGQHYYDFCEGGILFASPNQMIGGGEETIVDAPYFTLFIHPDFFLGYPLAKKIKEYGFFSYAVNEALHLSEKEKETMLSIFNIIEEELNSRIDEFSQDVVIAQIELLLNYANRFYKRQFITRKAANNNLLQKMEEILEDYFIKEKPLTQGIPTVQYLSENLNVSASYLSDMLRSFTAQNAQQHIHQKLIEKAKEKLSATNLSVSEIAYKLGFEHPQSFSKLFKKKMDMTPMEFKQSFN